MAKSDSFFGLRRGSTKTLTFSVLKGKQITKDRVEGGRNPRTPEQMVQRMCMATASAAYAQMKQIVDHSFEGITYGQTTMSEFIRVNADALRQSYLAGEDDKFSYNPYRDRLMYAGAYIMSRGTAKGVNSGSVILAGNMTDDKVGISFNGSDSVDFTADSILSRLGIAAGDMATACILYEDDTDGSAHFIFVRLTSLKGGSVVLTTANYGEYFKVESNVAISGPVIEGESLDFTVDAPGFVKGADANLALCVIHSQKQNGKWLRSNASMDVTNYQVRPSAADALETYPVGPSYVLNGGAIEE